MNDYISQITLDLNCSRNVQTIRAGQFDVGRKIEATITANGESFDVSNCTAVLKLCRSDKSCDAIECSINSNTVIAEIDRTTLSVRGLTVAKITISDSSKTFSTQAFFIDVDSALEGNITTVEKYSILNHLIEQIHLITETGGILVDDELSQTSQNPARNSVITAALKDKLDNIDSAIKNNNIANNAITSEKIANTSVSKKHLSDDLKDGLFLSNYKNIIDTLTVENCYYLTTSGKKTEYSKGLATYFAVESGAKYKVTGKSLYNIALAVFFDEQGNLLNYYGLESGTTYTDEIITIPSECCFVAFQSHSTVPLIVKEYQQIATVADCVTPLKSKTIYIDGDSIAYGQGSNGYSYADFIADNNQMIMTKCAKSGASIAVRTGRTDSIYERIANLEGSYDYILLDGGINDMFVSVALGTLSTDFDGEYDTSTAVGALESICYLLVTNFFTAKKLFILVHKKTNYYAQQKKYWDAYKSVLTKWGIPYVDLSVETNLYACNGISAADWFANGDGTHPLKSCYEKFYVPIITSKLKEL